jgi:hypothetical protein
MRIWIDIALLSAQTPLIGLSLCESINFLSKIVWLTRPLPLSHEYMSVLHSLTLSITWCESHCGVDHPIQLYDHIASSPNIWKSLCREHLVQAQVIAGSESQAQLSHIASNIVCLSRPRSISGFVLTKMDSGSPPWTSPYQPWSTSFSAWRWHIIFGLQSWGWIGKKSSRDHELRLDRDYVHQWIAITGRTPVPKSF